MNTKSDTKVIDMLASAKANNKRAVAVKHTPAQREAAKSSNVRFLRASTASAWSPTNDGPDAA